MPEHSQSASMTSRQPLWRASSRMSGRVASRRNVTRLIVVVFSFIFLMACRGRSARPPGDHQLFRNSNFGWRMGRRSQTAQNQSCYALCSPRLDPALQRPELCLTGIRLWKHCGQPIHQYVVRRLSSSRSADCRSSCPICKSSHTSIKKSSQPPWPDAAAAKTPSTVVRCQS
ncbi:hypothetical protein AWB69_08688 [Caballeronia udeis]|uniref:Uncharacterized protein n=1 Tax=Caballeronia udeis TaxID=1232866 RepID=A0A158JTH2_9BURK|nr:hypothetical protein AWB69_08688 [Caballeronia udeis]